MPSTKHRSKSRLGATLLSVGLLPVALLGGDIPTEPATTNEQAAVALGASQYNCSLTITDTHSRPNPEQYTISDGDNPDRNLIKLHVSLALNAGALATAQARFPGGDHGHGPVIWYSPSISTYRLDGRQYTTTPGFPVAGSSELNVFHDDKSPTGDDLHPEAWAAPRENQPIGSRDGVFMGTRISMSGFSAHDGRYEEVMVFKECGELVHDAPHRWSVVPASANAEPFVVTHHANQ